MSGRVTAELDQASLRRVQAAIDRAAGQVRDGSATAVEAAAGAVWAIERALVPVDTGALRDGIEVRYGDNKETAVIGVFNPDLYYALFVEWGTTIRPPAPFAVPAAERARTILPDEVRGELSRRLRAAS